MALFKDLQVLILAAGKGTRMYSELPKVLFQVCGESLLQRTIKAVSGLKPKRIVVVVGYQSELVEKELDFIKKDFPETEIVSSLQEKQFGTGHAVISALGSLDKNVKNVFILPGDSPLLKTKILKDFLRDFEVSKSALSLLSCLHPNPTGFGRIIRENNLVKKIIEEKDCTPEQRIINEINASIYLANYDFLLEGVKSLKPNNAQGEYYFTDIVASGVDQGDKVTAYVTKDYSSVSGANTRYEMSVLEAVRREEINRGWMEKGVTMEDPKNTYIDEEVEIAADTFIGAGTRLKGKTVIESGVVIEGESLISNSTIAAKSKIKLSCYIESSTIGEACNIGPFAHLRPESVLEKNVKIGNFVETKKVIIQQGAKASHLTYLGDCSVGEESNIGCGTITCNYDGEKKYQTTIGKNVFVGSNSCLVAPVTIADNSYIAAGSVINEDVPEKTLAIARARQENKIGWVERKLKKKEK